MTSTCPSDPFAAKSTAPALPPASSLARWLRRLSLTAWPSLALALAQPAAAQNAAPPALRITTASFQSVALNPTREAAAVVVPRNESRIAAEVAGTVLRWGPDSGASVRRGELLVELDATDHRLARDRAQAGLDAAQARLTLARSQRERARDLVAQGFLSQEALAAREADLQLAQAEQTGQRLALASAERSRLKTRVLAPFDASVRQRLAQTGEAVSPGTPVYVLVQRQGAEVSAQLSPEDADSLRQSSDARFVRADGAATALQLLRVSATLNSPARTVDVRLAAEGLVPGRDGRLVWRDPRAHLPAALLTRRDGSLGVFTVDGGRARFVTVPFAQEGRATPAQLPPDTLIVTQGHQALRQGDRVGP